MQREILVQLIEKLHQPRGYVLGVRQVRGERQARPETAPVRGRRPQRVLGEVADVISAVAERGVAQAQVAIGDGVEVGGVELEELALAVDQDGGLQGLRGARVVADAVVREVVEDFEREEPAWFWDQGVPVEDGGVDDGDVFGVAAGFGALGELGGL